MSLQRTLARPDDARLQSFSLVMDAVVKDEERIVGLAKQLATSFLIRGAQLAVVKRLDSRYVVKTHKDLLQEAIKNVSTYEKSKNKKRLTVSVSFFRALVPLLKGVESRDALAMCVYPVFCVLPSGADALCCGYFQQKSVFGPVGERCQDRGQADGQNVGASAGVRKEAGVDHAQGYVPVCSC